MPSVHASQHAGEVVAVEFDGLQHLTTFANAHTTPGGDIRVPDGVFGIEANAVRVAVTEVCPHPPVGQAAGYAILRVVAIRTPGSLIRCLRSLSLGDSICKLLRFLHLNRPISLTDNIQIYLTAGVDLR